MRLSKKQSRTLIKQLVETGELAYTYAYGRTFLEISYNRPVRVSDRVVLKPPRYPYRPRPREVVVQIQAGTSFGAGQHPSTRLALKGIDAVFSRGHTVENAPADSVLDIGTGTGVLVIAAVCLGVTRGLGIDLDACARVEAVANVSANALDDRIAISGQPVETLQQQFSLITANLRYPSLIRLGPVLEALTAAQGVLVLSGIQEAERQDVLGAYTARGFNPTWTGKELGWTAVVLQKQAVY